MAAEIQDGLRYVFQTDSPYTVLISGSGHAGMEAVIANLLEPGETIVVGNHGIWGERVLDLADRYGGELPSVGTLKPPPMEKSDHQGNHSQCYFAETFTPLYEGERLHCGLEGHVSLLSSLWGQSLPSSALLPDPSRAQHYSPAQPVPACSQVLGLPCSQDSGPQSPARQDAIPGDD